MRLLVVGKLNGQLSTAVKMAMSAGAKVSHVETCEAATHALRAGQGADLLMVDYELDIAGLIAANEAERIRVPVVACGVAADAAGAAGAIKAGAKEFIPLPPDAELIAAVLAAVSDDDRPMVVRDASMQAVISMADQIAPSDASILITGESGVGKEVIARYDHQKSRRSQRPFISVNCAAIPDNLLESELFGHEKGAFTGAVNRGIGRFEQAAGGTLFLDEIGDMPPDLQTRLLRVLSDGQFYRVGGHTPLTANVRVIAATHQDLEARVRQGLFREDLYHRLNVIRLRLPPMRERREDIPMLARHFLAKSARDLGVEGKRLTDAALAFLAAQEWAGNVRQLENLCHWMTVMAPGQVVDVKDLPPEVRGDAQSSAASPESDWRRALEREVTARLARGESGVADPLTRDFETALIVKALAHTGGRRIEAATLLGIGRNTLTRKIQELKIDTKD